MGSGITRMRTGSFAGTGAEISIETVGFTPSKVEILNEGGLATAVWTDTMADGEALKQVTAGTLSKVTTNGVTPLTQGFKLGADTDLNVSGELVHWVASE